MPRLFTGIVLPRDVIWQLSMMRSGLSGAHWIDPDNYHITLRFAGDMPEAQANRFADALCDVHFDSFDLEFSGMGSFGGNKPRSLWIAVKRSPALDDLHKAHERAARYAGLPAETRSFMPHVTLARLRNVRTYTVAEYFSRQGGFLPPSFTVNHFALLSARPITGGGPYAVEERYEARNAGYDDEVAA